MHFVHLSQWIKSWLGTLISYCTIKWLRETKSVLYEHRLNQYFAFFYPLLRKNQFIHFSNDVSFHFRMFVRLIEMVEQSCTAFFCKIAQFEPHLFIFSPLKWTCCICCVLYRRFKSWDIVPSLLFFPKWLLTFFLQSTVVKWMPKLLMCTSETCFCKSQKCPVGSQRGREPWRYLWNTEKVLISNTEILGETLIRGVAMPDETEMLSPWGGKSTK